VIIVPGEPASFTDRIHNRASALRLDVIRQIQIAIPGDSGALVAGFVTGDDGHLSAAGDATFRAAGLSHLTAVSGANLAMLLSMIGIAGHLGRRGRYSIAIAGVVILWGYALFVGLPPPTLRAALLATAVGIARLLGRPVDVIGLSLFTVVAQIAIRPEDAWSVSFHLSTAASLGLAAGLSRYPMVDDARNVGDLFSATALAQLTTLPIIVGVFGTAPLFSLFANIAAAPFAGFSFALGVFGAATSMVSRDLGTILLIPAGWSAEIVLGIASLYGRAWSVLSFREWPEPVIVLMTIVVLLLTLAIGGELSLLRRQFANERSIRADSS
jgi:competence protein ComEC